jgi:hypothetical protein
MKRTAYRPQGIDISTAIAAFVRHDAPKLHRKKWRRFGGAPTKRSGIINPSEPTTPKSDFRDS